MRSIRTVSYLTLILGMWPAGSTMLRAQVSAAAAAPAAPPVLKVEEHPVIRYPSLEPMEEIYVYFNDSIPITDAVNSAAHNPNWNCLSPAFYRVVETSPKNTTKKIGVRDVFAAGFDPTTNKLFTRCDGAGDPGGVSLILSSSAPSTDKIQVTLYSDQAQTKVLAQSDGTLKLSSSSWFTSSGTLQSAPGEALTNGKTRDVGQMTLALADTNLLRNSPVNLYMKSTDLLSTDEKDNKSAFLVTLGGQFDWLARVYSPIQIEERVQGNQVATNLSAVSSLSLSMLTPWSRSAPVFNNKVIGAPLAPALALAGLYTHRINQLVAAKSPLLAVEDFSLNPSLTWSSISIPVSCKVFAWLDGIGSSSAKAAAKPATPPTKYCVGSTVDLGGWYLPLDHTKAGSQQFEGYGDASILLPLAGFSRFSMLFPYLTAGDAAKTQIQIKYSDSVNAANNYARTRGWTFGFQASK